MNLILENWNKQDGQNFEQYLESLKNEDRVEWTRRIVCTNYPVLAIPSPTLRQIAKDILMGNYEDFLKLKIFSSYEAIIINGYIINKITDFDTLKNYLSEYLKHIDCWATCDCLSFNTKYYESELFTLARDYSSQKDTFTRRVGLKILFNFLDTDKYLPDIFEIIDSFYTEVGYYVNMINAWLICECFIKHRNYTLTYLESNHHLNTFTLNKAIQKCRDSYRVSKEDKEMLLKFKR